MVNSGNGFSQGAGQDRRRTETFKYRRPFLDKHDLKFEVLPTSDALGQAPNRSSVVELPMAGIVTGAPACNPAPEEHPRPARISLYFPKRAPRGR